MKKLILCSMLLLVTACSFAVMNTMTLQVASGETKDIVSSVPWPADAAIAKFNPPAKVNGILATRISFCVSSKVVVEGPTTVTIEYGTPEAAPESGQ